MDGVVLSFPCFRFNLKAVFPAKTLAVHDGLQIQKKLFQFLMDGLKDVKTEISHSFLAYNLKLA